jgi:hypothetical protein
MIENPGARDRRPASEVSGRLHDEYVKLVAQHVNFGSPCRHMSQATMTISVDRVIKDPRATWTIVELVHDRSHHCGGRE